MLADIPALLATGGRYISTAAGASFQKMTDDPPTEELMKAQAGREAAERARAVAAEDEEETAQHERRAEKAAYLREKLEERAESEREAGE